MSSQWIEMELAILDGIQKYMGSNLGNELWPFITHLGDHGAIWIVLTILLLYFPETRKAGYGCAVALFCSLLFTNGLLKPFIARTRPYAYSGFKILIEAPGDFSFPSGHTSASFAVAFVLLKERLTVKSIKLDIPVLILAALIAFSRLYLYVHFLTDVLGGVIVAYLCGWIGYKTTEWIWKRKRDA